MPKPGFLKPMLATLVAEPFDNPEWYFEVKWDGYRALAIKDKKSTRAVLLSRNEKDFSLRYDAIAQELAHVSESFILDGEIVAAENNTDIPSFQKLQEYTKSHQGVLSYQVFDILFFDGEDLKEKELLERKKVLNQFFKKYRFEHTFNSPYISDHGISFFKTVASKGYEGIVAKNSKSFYYPGQRRPDWLKIKSLQTQEAVICGFTEPRKTRKYFGALVLGVYENKELTYIGHTGGGFNDASLKTMYKELKKITQKDPPFRVVPKTNMPVTWVKPRIVCQVKFHEWTRDGSMRQPIFLGIREDKDPREVRREKPKSYAK